MITDTFDNQTEEIIKVWRNENAKKVDACILTFSNNILQYVLERFDCEKIGDLYSSNGANPVYGFTYAGGHPMAGTHLSGYKNSRATMFQNASMIIVPPTHDDIELLDHI